MSKHDYLTWQEYKKLYRHKGYNYQILLNRLKHEMKLYYKNSEDLIIVIRQDNGDDDYNPIINFLFLEQSINHPLQDRFNYIRIKNVLKELEEMNKDNLIGQVIKKDKMKQATK